MLVLFPALTACGAAHTQNPTAAASTRSQVVHGSRVGIAHSFAEVRRTAVAIAFGVAGETRMEAVASGPLQGASIARTPFRVDEVVWGTLDASSITMSQLVTQAFSKAAYASGERYLAFVVPDEIDPERGNYAALNGIVYRLVGDAYVFNGVLEDDLPSSMPESEARDRVRG